MTKPAWRLKEIAHAFKDAREGKIAADESAVIATFDAPYEPRKQAGDEWRQTITALHAAGVLTWAEMARLLGRRGSSNV